ncbi:putative DNA helicase ino80, partial [Kickxella alabastrina]
MAYDRTSNNPHNLNSLLSPHGSRSGGSGEDSNRAAERDTNTYTQHTPSYAATATGSGGTAGESVFPASGTFQSPPAPSSTTIHQGRGEYSRYNDGDSGSGAYDYTRYRESRPGHDHSGTNPEQQHSYAYRGVAGGISSRYSREVEHDPYTGRAGVAAAHAEYPDYRDEYARQQSYDYGAAQHHHQNPQHQHQQHQPYEYEYEHEYERSHNVRDSRQVFDREAYGRHGHGHQPYQYQQQQQQQQGVQDEYYSGHYGYERSVGYGQEAAESTDYAQRLPPAGPVDSTAASSMYYEGQQSYQQHGRHKYASHSSAYYGAGREDSHVYHAAGGEPAGYSSYGQHAAQNHSDTVHHGHYHRYRSPAPAVAAPVAAVGYAATPAAATAVAADYHSPTAPGSHTKVFQRGSAYETDPYASERPAAAYSERARGSAGIGITALLSNSPEAAASTHQQPLHDDRAPMAAAGRYDSQHAYAAGGGTGYGRASARYERDTYHGYHHRERDTPGYAGYSSYTVDERGHAEPHGVMSISQLVGGERSNGTHAENSAAAAGSASAMGGGEERGAPDVAYAYGNGGRSVDAVAGYDHYTPNLADAPQRHRTSYGPLMVSAEAPPPANHHEPWAARAMSQQVEPIVVTDDEEPAAAAVDDDETDSGDDNKPLATRAGRRPARSPSAKEQATAASGDDSSKLASKRRKRAAPKNGTTRRYTKSTAENGVTKRKPSRRVRGGKKVELSREYVYDEDEDDDEPAVEPNTGDLSGRFTPEPHAANSGNHAGMAAAAPRTLPMDSYSVDEHVQAYIHHVKQRTDRAVAKYEEREKRKALRMHEHVVQRYGPYLRGYHERTGQLGPAEQNRDGAGGDTFANGDSLANGDAFSNGDAFADEDAYADNGNACTAVQVPPMGYFSPARADSPAGSAGSVASEPLARHIDDSTLRPSKPGRSTLWSALAVEHIPRAHRHMHTHAATRTANLRKVALLGQREARRLYGGPAPVRGSQPNASAPAQPPIAVRAPKELLTRARRSMREMLMFWKRHEKEEREMRKRAEREAAERLKQEEEARESRRQTRKLNFLITQTELYSHFVGSKMGEGVQQLRAGGGDGDAAGGAAPVLGDIDFDADDDASLAAQARRGAQNALAAAQAQTREFDDVRRQQREARDDGGAETQSQPQDANVAEALDAMDFLDPETMAGTTDIAQPRMLMCQLKEYQLKGLNWLANLYEQGINGILADEMGLGKTVQSISLLAYLAETHNIWGPFMVVAPASTLHNWQQELARFVPEFKVLPYWGSQKDRKVLRKSLWNPKNLSRKDSAFHVLVTSYQLIVSDEAYLNRVKWQYMVLDEAQAIKSSTSARWKTLLGFHCRNRLLLTGTPIQNSMQELWALLHFIMPTLFDSHEEFSEWFSRDIEAHAENRSTLNRHQLQRLHVILKPFMLRRHKRHVQHELGEKIEHLVPCDLTQRQKVMYRGLMSKISVPDLLERLQSGSGHGGKEDSEESLMNLVMQFRKVCSHPELFERAEVDSPYVVGNFPTTGSLAREGDELAYSFSTRSLAAYQIPKMLYRESLDVPNVRTVRQSLLQNRLSLWSPENIARDSSDNGLFGLLRLCEPSTSVAIRAFTGSLAERLDDLAELREQQAGRVQYQAMCAQAGEQPVCAGQQVSVMHALMNVFTPENLRVSPALASLALVTANGFEHSPMSLISPAYKPPAVSPPADLVISDRSAVWENESMLLANPLAKRVTCGRDFSPEIDWSQPFRAQGLTDIWMPSMDNLIRYSGKMAVLDRLLVRLKQEGHRVLLYFQMTKMIDLFEEYLAYRKYTYLRLDGSSKISDRRDMVMDWQTRDDIFIFLLSTRAGGLGINLTAADTVIFFESDWNPTVDSQAMDRAHRLGQTKQV